MNSQNSERKASQRSADKIQNVKVLYMEDDPGEARLLQITLQREGYRVDLAQDGEQGLTMMQNDSYDVLVVDQSMPFYTGLEVIRCLSSQGSLPPTIMVTGAGDEKTAVEAMKLGCSDYLVKDTEGGYRELLKPVIENVLEQRRISEDKKSEAEALRAREERFRKIIEENADGIVIVDADGIVLFMNPAAESLFDCKAQEYQSKSLPFMIGADSVSQIVLPREGGEETKVEIRVKETVWGGKKAFLASARDVSEVSKAEKAVSSKPERERDVLTLKGLDLESILSDTQALKAPLIQVPAREWRPEVVTYYNKFVEHVMSNRDKIRNGQEINPPSILTDLSFVVNRNLIEELYEYAVFCPSDYEELLIHDMRVMFVALIVGEEMGYDFRKLLRLGLAGLLTNVGLYKIPEALLSKIQRLDDEEMALIREHPRESYEILSKLGVKYRWLAEVALQIHERADGSGYPYRLKGENIHELSYIVGLSDIYTAMTENRPYRDGFVPFDVVNYIIGECSKQFPSRILKAFLRQISFFPVNTYVKLNKGSIGRVLHVNKDQALRPTIELVYDSKGLRITGPTIIDLSENFSLNIIECLHQKDLP